MASSSSSSSPPPPPSSSHQSSSPPFSCSVFDAKDYNTNPSVVVDQQNQTSVIQETTTTTHHRTLGKSEQSVSSAPKHKSTTPFMKTLLINKKPQIIWEQKSRDTKLVMQPKIKKTQPPDENDDVMSTDEEESESAEEEEIESAEEESQSSEGVSERRRRRRRRIGRRYPEYVAKPSRSCSEASSEEYNPRERMIMFHESEDESEDEDDIRLLEYIQEYKEEEAENGFGNSLPLSLTDGRPAKINVGYLLIYIQKEAGKYHGYTASKLRNKILKMQRKYKKLLREKGDDPTPR